jgi:hypothetical protein
VAVLKVGDISYWVIWCSTYSSYAFIKSKSSFWSLLDFVITIVLVIISDLINFWSLVLAMGRSTYFTTIAFSMTFFDLIFLTGCSLGGGAFQAPFLSSG